MEISSELNLELNLDLDTNTDLGGDRHPDHYRDRFVTVIVDCIGIDDLLTYSIPDDVELQIGDILSVPLGNRQVGAIALEIGNNAINSVNSINSDTDSPIEMSRASSQ